MALIADLRARMERGDLATLGRIDFGDGLPPLMAEHAIGLMLADLDELDEMTPGEANAPVNVTRRASLLADFRTIQRLFG